MIGNKTITEIVREEAKELVEKKEARYIAFGFDKTYFFEYQKHVYQKRNGSYVLFAKNWREKDL